MKNMQMTNDDYSKPIVYFYIDDNGKIAYIGKANGTIVDRVKAHEKEKKFIECGCKFDIRYMVFEKSSDMDIAEKIYIKSLKPYLNVADTTLGFFPDVKLNKDELPQFIGRFEKASKKKKISKTIPRINKKQRIEEYKDYFKEVDNYMLHKICGHIIDGRECIPIYFDSCDMVRSTIRGIDFGGYTYDHNDCFVKAEEPCGMWSEFFLIPVLDVCVQKRCIANICIREGVIILNRDDFLDENGYDIFNNFRRKIISIALEYRNEYGKDKDNWKELTDIFYEAKKGNYQKLINIYNDSLTNDIYIPHDKKWKLLSPWWY